MSLDLEKSALRKKAKIMRAAVHADAGDAAARKLVQIGLDFLGLWMARSSRWTISGYAAMPGEIDPALLLAHLHIESFGLALPVTIGRAKPLVFRRWAPGDTMGRGFQDIAEPLPSAPEVFPDVVLLPLLAFDDHGNRLGYGGGHYDRTLAQLRAQKPVIAVGLAYDQQKVDAVPHERYDQRLDWILTPSGACAFTES